MVSTIPCSLKVLSEGLLNFYASGLQREVCKTLIEVQENNSAHIWQVLKC